MNYMQTDCRQLHIKLQKISFENLNLKKSSDMAVCSLCSIEISYLHLFEIRNCYDIVINIYKVVPIIMSDIRSFFGGGYKEKSIKNVDVIGIENKLNTNVSSEVITTAKPPVVKEIIENNKSDEVSLSDIPVSLSVNITWKVGERVPYLALVNTFEKIENISSRLEKENLFCNLFRSVILTTPGDLECILYLASNTLFPAYDGLELGIGDSLLIKAVVESTGRNKNAVQADYDKEGDLGNVAAQSRSSQSTLGFAMKPKPLSSAEVLEQFRIITRTNGDKSMDRKVSIIK